MKEDSRFSSYYFFEDEWDSLEEIRSEFQWEIPENLNMGECICDRHKNKKNENALLYQDDIRDREEELSYLDLKRKTGKLANYLTKNFSKGDRIAVCMPSIPENIISHIGIWKAGMISVPISPLSGKTSLQYLLENSESKGVFISNSMLDLVEKINSDLSHLENIIVFNEESLPGEKRIRWKSIMDYKKEFEPVETKATDEVMIIYTSGSTGLPKGAVHTHQMVLGKLPAFMTGFCDLKLNPKEFFWTPVEWAWMGSIGDFIIPILFFGKTLLAYDGGRFDPEKTCQLIENYGLTCLNLPPASLEMIRKNIGNPKERYDFESVRFVASGGAKMNKKLANWTKDTFSAKVGEGYGQTEGSPLVNNCPSLFEYKYNLGKPVIGLDAKVVDSNGDSLPPGEVGELAVSRDSPQILKEYWKNPEKTKKKVNDGLMFTGDLVKMSEDGYVSFVSRKDDVILSSGHRIGPEEIENVLDNHEAVSESAVVGVPDEVRGEVVKAFIVLNQNYEPDDELKEDLQAYVSNELEKFKYPRLIEFIDEIPRTDIGKKRRVELREKSSG